MTAKVKELNQKTASILADRSGPTFVILYRSMAKSHIRDCKGTIFFCFYIGFC
nr:MAG TPA: hypothetical protein [Bacteriophage sp.]